MENQAVLADRLFAIACSESYWKRLHEREMRMAKEWEKKHKAKQRG